MNITYGGGEVYLEHNVNIGAIQIHYTGKIKATSTLDDGWMLACNKNKILIVNLNEEYDVNLLFKYNGSFNITSAMVVDRDLETYNLRINTQYIDYWNLIDSKWGDFNQKYTEFNREDKPDINIVNSKIIQKGLITKSEEFYYEDGTVYPVNKPYHIHENNIIMTGEEHTKDSKVLYRKNNLDKIDKGFSITKKISNKQPPAKQITKTKRDSY